MKLSVVSPVYRAEAIIDTLVERISEEASKITDDFEIILVEDGGPDNSWEKILENCKRNKKVKGVKFSRNFGQHYAITAGLEMSSGDYTIVMDCDLQDNPGYFSALVEKAKEGYGIVYTVKEKRNHNIFKNFTANIFNYIFNFLVENKQFKGSNNIGSYSLLRRDVVDAFLSVKDYRRHYLMVLRWLGFPYATINVMHSKRFAGKSSYNFSKLINHALDGITSQSDKLLRLTAAFGFFLSLSAFLSALAIIISYSIKPFQAGWASLMVMMLFVGGLIILSVGICGVYIGKIFEQTKNRPLYIVESKVNF